jgi:hypothetical protein
VDVTAIIKELTANNMEVTALIINVTAINVKIMVKIVEVRGHRRVFFTEAKCAHSLALGRVR